jgi:hypothetical protein
LYSAMFFFTVLLCPALYSAISFCTVLLSYCYCHTPSPLYSAMFFLSTQLSVCASSNVAVRTILLPYASYSVCNWTPCYRFEAFIGIEFFTVRIVTSHVNIPCVQNSEVLMLKQLVYAGPAELFGPSRKKKKFRASLIKG